MFLEYTQPPFMLPRTTFFFLGNVEILMAQFWVVGARARASELFLI
jgi:hypothetical protein